MLQYHYYYPVNANEVDRARPTNEKILSSENKSFFKKDRLVKAIGVPVLAASIANFAGLITNHLYTAFQLIIYYSYFVVLAWMIWEGNVYLFKVLKRVLRFPFASYYKNVLILYGSIIVYTAAIATSGIVLWFTFSAEDASAYHHSFIAVVVIVVSALFVTNLYEIFYLKEQQHDIENRANQLNVAKTHAELVALKNQIDPHFLFNSLNTLSYLISSKPDSAKLYNDTLAKVYRYILINREKNLISAADEIEFLSNFFYLLKLRFGNAVNMTIEIRSMFTDDCFLPPISLQLLLENAIKHNELNAVTPLGINVTVFSNHILIKNKIIQKAYVTQSTGTGLKNLDNRYKLLTGKNILIYQDDGFFTVKLPLVNTQA